MEKYFVISAGEGEPRIREYTKEELVEWLNEEGANPEFMDTIEENDMNYWGYKRLIIKGSIETPKPVKIIERLEI